MHIAFTDEQMMVRDSAEKFLRDNYEFEKRQSVVKSGRGFSSDMWQQFAELGWLALPFSEEVGGFGGGSLEIMLLSEAMGRYLVVEPYLESVVMAGTLLELGRRSPRQEALLGQLMEGSAQVSLAYSERGCELPTSQQITTKVSRTADGFQLNGTKRVVYNGPAANQFIVTAIADDNPDELFLLLVAEDAAGVRRSNYPTYDDRHASDVSFTNVVVGEDAVICDSNDSLELLRVMTARSIVALGAEAIGAMDALVAATVDYTKQRKQFGQPISKFQVLRHRMADMFMQVELTRSLLLAAAWNFDNKTDDSAKLLAALKARIGKAGRYVGQNAIQLHGGIGVTDELNVGHYFKRLTMIETLLGSRDYHLQAFQRYCA